MQGQPSYQLMRGAAAAEQQHAGQPHPGGQPRAQASPSPVYSPVAAPGAAAQLAAAQAQLLREVGAPNQARSSAQPLVQPKSALQDTMREVRCRCSSFHLAGFRLLSARLVCAAGKKHCGSAWDALWSVVRMPCCLMQK